VCLITECYKRASEWDLPDLLDASVGMHRIIIIIIIIITRQVQHIKEKNTYIIQDSTT